MILHAKKHNKQDNITFLVKDMKNLPRNKFNVAIAINSIITPKIKDINKIFQEIHKTLKPKGKFLCVLPAMEVYLYQALLLSEKFSDVKKQINNKEHDFTLGITNFNGKQKNYYEFEIIYRLKKAGFKNIKISKVLYSWKEFKKAGQFYFPKEELPWDWYVFCEK